ncbi:TPA: transposase [Citrobacter werkmanii]
MGFWDTAGRLALSAAKEGLNTVRDMKETHDQLEEKSSPQLKQIADSSRAGEIEKRLARKILRDRGDR